MLKRLDDASTAVRCAAIVATGRVCDPQDEATSANAAEFVSVLPGVCVCVRTRGCVCVCVCVCDGVIFFPGPNQPLFLLVDLQLTVFMDPKKVRGQQSRVPIFVARDFDTMEKLAKGQRSLQLVDFPL